MLDDEGYCMECGEHIGGGDCPDCDHDADDFLPNAEPGDDYRTTRGADDA